MTRVVTWLVRSAGVCSSATLAPSKILALPTSLSVAVAVPLVLSVVMLRFWAMVLRLVSVLLVCVSRPDKAASTAPYCLPALAVLVVNCALVVAMTVVAKMSSTPKALPTAWLTLAMLSTLGAVLAR